MSEWWPLIVVALVIALGGALTLLYDVNKERSKLEAKLDLERFLNGR